MKMMLASERNTGGTSLQFGIGTAWITLALVACACATRVPGDTITKLSIGVNKVRGQAQQALRAANQFARDASIEYALTQPGLSDASFVSAIRAEDIAAWDQAFGIFGEYVGNLDSLLPPETPRKVRAGVLGFVKRMANLSEESVALPPAAEQNGDHGGRA